MSIGAGPNPSLTGEDPEPLGSSDGHTSSGSRSLEHARYEESTCEADNEFHGPASTTTFMKHIREIIEDGTPTNVASVSQLRQSTSHIPLRSPDHMLPPRQLADSLLGHYWEFVHPLYPFLHKPDFDGMYESLCTGREFPNNACKVMRVDKATSLCVLNLVFALGCQYHHESGPEKAEATAEVFLQTGSFTSSNRSHRNNQQHTATCAGNAADDAAAVGYWPNSEGLGYCRYGSQNLLSARSSPCCEL